MIDNDTTALDKAVADLNAIIAKSAFVPVFKPMENSDHVNSGFSAYTNELTAFLSLQPISLEAITALHGTTFTEPALPPALDRALWYLLHLGFRNVNVQAILHEEATGDPHRGVKTWHQLITHYSQRCYSDFISLEQKLETLSRCPCPQQESEPQAFEDWSHNFQVLARHYKETHALANETILCVRVILHLPDSLLAFKQLSNDRSDSTVKQLLKELRTHWVASFSHGSAPTHTVLTAVGQNNQVTDDLLAKLLDAVKRNPRNRAPRDPATFCEKCGRGPHKSEKCKTVKPETICNSCQQTGHISTGSLCPNRK